MVDIVGSTTIVQASGIESLTVKLQGGGPTNSNVLVATDSPEEDGKILTTNVTVFNATDLIKYGGASNSGNIVTPSFEEASDSTTINVPTLSGIFEGNTTGSAFLQGVVGSSGTVERFFDRSPFYFTDSETDPNTERDLREIEPFLIFSSAIISTYPVTRRIPESTQIIVPTVTGAGDDFLTNKTNSFAFITSKPPSLEQVIGANGVILGPGDTVSGTSTTLTGPISISGSADIDQQDESAPYFDETQPVSGTRFNDPNDLTLEFHIKDDGVGLDTGAMDVWIDGLQVITASTTITGSTWPVASRTVLSSSDYQYIFTRGFPYDQQATVTVSGELADIGGNSVIAEYDFTMLGSGSLGATISGSPDGDPPVITPIDPVDLQTQVSPDTSLVWTLVDNAAGVDSAATRLYINGVLRLENDAAIDGSFSRTGNAQDGYTYIFNPDEQFEFGSTVSGTIESTDLATLPNTDSLDYEFTIAPTDSLQITNFFLSDGESTLLTSGTAIEVDVIDTLYGVSSGTTYMTVNGVVPPGLVASGILAGSGIHFSVPAIDVVDFREEIEVFVHAENNFPGTFPQVEEETYRLLPGYDVKWPNRILDEYEVIFPYVTRIPVLLDVKNFGKSFNAASDYFFFLTENQAFSNLGATLVSNIKVADMPAAVTVLNTFYEYGKTIVLEIEIDDFDGNQLRFSHTYTIEPRP